MATNADVIVLGEALIDLVVTPGGEVTATLGGAPFNTARALGRLEVETSFVGTISQDRFGVMLESSLLDDGVNTSALKRTQRPTTLALAEVSESGSATYRFYIDGTSIIDIDLGEVPIDPAWVITGGLACVLEPGALSVAAYLERIGDATQLMVDVNCRPSVIDDRDRYMAHLSRVLHRADVIKVSEEDLAYLYPKREIVDACTALRGARTNVVIVTRGSDDIMLVTSDVTVSVPVPPADVIDTIGAGDTFNAGFIAWCMHRGLTVGQASIESLSSAIALGARAAAVTVSRRGCDPPYRSDLDPAMWD